MKVLLGYESAELNIKNSRFLAEAFIAESQAQARDILHSQKQKYADATHVVHAFVTGKNAEVNGMSDDGEPSGTAGRPMLDVLKGSGITNIMVTVTRWFGGTLLGTGGLVRAYSDSMKAVIEKCQTEELIEKKSFSFTVDYSQYENVRHLISFYHIGELKEDFSSGVEISGNIWLSEYEEFAQKLKDLSRGMICI
ncbi:YigZ family protein [Treponema rectale]|uniref:YigZ family protein n=1 Tax=Treponema rectale TaxID=744512 RepID=A0A840SEX4_9SPIR|nr:YigZ family protein [Treponema rectale]MBB5218002.1 putative YigZ family protein [Treponema rectale]QOS40283.1 YigZ family protein [Treponema rectale]